MIMRYFIKLYFIALLCCPLSVSLAEAQTEVTSGNTKTIRAVIQSDSPPTFFKDRVTGEASGFVVDVMNELARRGGYSVTYRFEKNWDAIAPLIISGKADVAPGQGITEDKAEIAAFTLPIGTFPVSVFARAKDNTITALTDIKTIGVTKGSSSSDILEKQYPTIQVVTYESNESGLMGLLSGRIDAFCTSATTLTRVAIDAGLEDKIKIIGEPLSEIKRAIAVRKDNPDLLKDLNNLVAEFSGTDEYKRLYAKWHASPRPYWTGRKVLIVILAIILITVAIMALWHYRAVLRLNRVLRQNNIELQEAERKIKHLADEWQKTFDAIPSSVFLRNADGMITQCNIATEQIIGRSRDQIIGRNCWEIMHGTSELIPECPIPAMKSSGKRETMDMPLGDQWYRESVDSVMDEAGSLVGAVHIMEDITERKRVENALKQSEEKYRRLFEESQDMIFISTYDGMFIDVNPAGVRLLGYPSKEVLLPVLIRDTYADADDRVRLLDLLYRQGSVTDFETKLMRQDGQKILVSITASVATDERAKITAIQGIIRDITEHRKIEDQLRQSQKMESVGTLAGGIAHDFNNILTAIIGYGQLAIRKMEPENPCRQNIEHILEAADKAAYLTQGLLSFSRTRMSNRNQVDLNELLKKTEMFLRRVIGEDIEFRTNLYRSPLLASLDPNQIEQVLMNLVTNARDAMPAGGALTITSEQIRLDEEFARRHGYGKAGSYGLITVSDSGIGMAEETRQRIFEPFFTTKEVGKGTGLGLAIIYGIIKQHDGFIDVYSEPGVGTTFRVYLPLIAFAGQETTTVAASEYPVGGDETILLAEDDEMLRRLAKSVLEEFGYKVIAAIDGEDALSKFLENRDRIDLLLTDLIMPKKSGKELYEAIKQMRPDMKTIFASGYSPDIVRDKVSLGIEATIVYKPISPMDLLKKVRSVLDKARK